MITGDTEDTMSTSSHDEAPDILRSERGLPPSHYTLKIESFSRLSEIVRKTNVEKYESGHFDSGGYKWKLLLYPYGNEKRNGNGHISLYLAIADKSTLPAGNCIHVNLKLFVYNQIEDKYLTIEDRQIRRYHSLKTEHGFHQLLPLSTFNDPSSGYLVDDCCAFGVEVHVLKGSGDGEKFSILKQQNYGTHVWQIKEFSKLQQTYHESEVFTVGDHKWTLMLYPKGDSRVTGKSLSFFLSLKDCNQHQRCKVYVECELSAKSQADKNHYEQQVSNWFCNTNSSWGYVDFMPLDTLHNPSNGYVVNDTLIVEAKITLVSVVRGLI